MQKSPLVTDIHIRKTSGVSVLSVPSIVVARADRAAPPAIRIDPPSPDAVPANFGRTDIIPAAAFGIVRPFPMAAIDIRPKKLLADPWSNKLIASDELIAKTVTISPK